MPTATPMIDARALVAAAFDLSAEDLVARGPERPDPARLGLITAYLNRRMNAEPVAYIVGEREFWSLPFSVGPGVLIPRPDTECLIEAICRAVPRRDQEMTLVDLGTGSGCILAALLAEYPNAFGLGIDREAAALEYARRNILALGFEGRAALIRGSWLDAIAPRSRAARRIDMLVANPPYIADHLKEFDPALTIAPDVACYEPETALYSGAKGLDSYRAIFAAAPAVLAPRGTIGVEIGYDQEDAVVALARNAFPQGKVSAYPDLEGRPRVVLAQSG